MVHRMIVLTRLSGSAFVLNADLVERLDSTPDTVVTLVDGRKYVVAEQITEVVDRVRDWRAGIIATSAAGPENRAWTQGAHLAVVPVRPTIEGEG